jgi:hypothetical protein
MKDGHIISYGPFYQYFSHTLPAWVHPSEIPLQNFCPLGRRSQRGICIKFRFCTCSWRPFLVGLRATSHTILRAQPLDFKHSHWWKRRSWFKFASHSAWGTNGVLWTQDGCKGYMDSYMAPNGSFIMVTWIIFKNHLLEVGLTQNWETMALRMLTPIDLFYFIMCEDPIWIKIHWKSIWLRVQSHMTSHYTWEHVTTRHDFEGVLEQPLDTFFWALTISWSRLLTRVW